jgi:type VI secretion system secreted protein VgrG
MTAQVEITLPGSAGKALAGRVHLREELGRLFELQVELLKPATETALQASSLLGQTVTLTIETGEDAPRFVSGMVVRFAQGALSQRFRSYHIEVRPRLWLLTRNAGCRIFENQTVVQILDTVFAAHGMQVDKAQIGSGYASRVICVQYRETDFNFVSRLMEEEGIYYFFKHADGAHTLVLGHDVAVHPAAPGGALELATASEEGSTSERVIFDWQPIHSMQPLKYSHSDFEFETPSADLLTSSAGTAAYAQPPTMEVFDHPGLYDGLPGSAPTAADMKTEGSRLAQLRQDEFDVQQLVASGVTHFRRMAVGSTFELSAQEASTHWLVTQASYDIDFGAYEASAGRTGGTGFSCHFSAIPKDTRFQPQRLTPRPFVQGPQTAMVVSGAGGGSDAGVDKYGRVRVKFHWVRSGKPQQGSSCWVRVAQPWAGKQFGFIALPRVGHEVVVNFLEGDPDRPLVTGSLYNAEAMPAYTLPAHDSVSGWRSRTMASATPTDANELRFEDKAGAEYLLLQAQKNFYRQVKANEYDKIGMDAFRTVGQNAYVDITQNLTQMIGGDIKAQATGDVQWSIGGATQLKLTGALDLKVVAPIAVAGDDALSVKLAQGLDADVGQAVKLKSGAAVHIVAPSGVVIDGGSTISLSAGGSFVVIDSGGVTIKGALVKINSGGSAGSAEAAQAAAPAEPQAPEKAAAATDWIAPSGADWIGGGGGAGGGGAGGAAGT